MVNKKSKQLVAKLIVTVAHPEGGDGLVIVDNKGAVYARTEKGWVPLDMTEATDDTQV